MLCVKMKANGKEQIQIDLGKERKKINEWHYQVEFIVRIVLLREFRAWLPFVHSQT